MKDFILGFGYSGERNSWTHQGFLMNLNFLKESMIIAVEFSISKENTLISGFDCVMLKLIFGWTWKNQELKAEVDYLKGRLNDLEGRYPWITTGRPSEILFINQSGGI